MEVEQQNLSLTEAATQFLACLPQGQKQAAQQEVNRFVRWYGGKRAIGELTIREIEGYAEGVGLSGTSPMKKLEPVKSFLTYAKKEGLIATNLAVHLRAVKASAKRGPKTKLSSQQLGPINLTSQGYAALESELASLKKERPRLAEELHRARADKDFRENAPLDAARERQGQVESRIRELEATLKAAAVIDEERSGVTKAELGCTVILHDLVFGEELCYILVNPNEANPGKGKLSVASPTGKALVERVKGDVIEVAAPLGKLSYRIEKIERGGS